MASGPVVIARIFGGLGNQLFCYAAARRLALANDVPLRLDVRSGFLRDGFGREYLLDRFTIPCQPASNWQSYLHPGGRARRCLERQMNARLPYAWRWVMREKASHAFDPRLLDLRVTHALYLEGYWQSERYFADAADIIRQDLRLSRPPNDASRALADRMRREESVSIHLRRFAEVRPALRHNVLFSPLRPDYYQRATAFIAARTNQPHFYVFCEDLDWAMHGMDPDLHATPVYVNAALGYDGDVDDLWLMSQCRHHIISNSTFGWWGAWLGGSEKGLVVAPTTMADHNTCWIPPRWIPL